MHTFRTFAHVLMAGAVVAAAGCSKPDWRTLPFEIKPMTSPASGNSASPQITTFAQGTFVSWVERGADTNTLKFAERSGGTWAPPITVVSDPKLFVNYADVPSVIRMADGTLVAHWTTETDPEAEAYDLHITYSKDQGKSWSEPITPHHDGTKTQHAFATLFEMPSRQLGVIWLDGRAAALSNTEDMAIQYASFDATWKQTAETTIDARVCECCPTAATMTADGMLAAFRNRSDTEVRDIYTSRLENGKWTESAPVHDDGWVIEACPINGPSVSARGKDVVAGWFTTKGDNGQAFVAFSSDSGRTWGAPVRVDETSTLGRVDVDLLEDGTALVSWIEYAKGASSLMVRRVERTGGKSPATSVTSAAGGATSGYQRMARSGNDVVFAWTESAGADGDGAQQVKTAIAPIPGGIAVR